MTQIPGISAGRAACVDLESLKYLLIFGHSQISVAIKYAVLSSMEHVTEVGILEKSQSEVSTSQLIEYNKHRTWQFLDNVHVAQVNKVLLNWTSTTGVCSASITEYYQSWKKNLFFLRKNNLRLYHFMTGSVD